jgi:hypothetical protein
VKGFSPEWLAIRERADAAARSTSLTSFIAAMALRGRALDLGGGTGSNVRYLAPKLSPDLHWTVVDNDAALLARAPSEAAACLADLNAVVEDAAFFQGCGLVTASALLDLVSRRWLVQLIARCRATESAVLFALTYDGRIACEPIDSSDDDIARLVNEHQRSDKGFGPALGPSASSDAVELLTSAGYEVRSERSDWVLALEESELQKQLLKGWAEAATEKAPQGKDAIDAWYRRRLAFVEMGQSRILVGHVDVAAVLHRI